MSESRIKQFEAFLSGKGQRLSNDRKVIAELVFTITGPLNGDIVLDALVKASPSRRFSRATVYRTLARLEESGLVRLN